MSNRTTLPRRYLPEGCFPAVSVEAALQHVFPGRGRPPPTGSPLPVALIDVDDMSFQENAGHVKRMYEKAMRDRQHQFIETEDFVRRSAQRWVNIINEFADASSTADAPPEVQAVDGAQENVPDVPMTSQLIGKMVLVLSDSPATSDVEVLSESEAVDRVKYLSLRAKPTVVREPGAGKKKRRRRHAGARAGEPLVEEEQELSLLSFEDCREKWKDVVADQEIYRKGGTSPASVDKLWKPLMAFLHVSRLMLRVPDSV